MNLKEKISEITSGYDAEVARTKLLSAFLGRVAISEAESITGLYDELDKVISGEIVHSAAPGDRRFISVPKKLLIDVATPLKKQGSDLLSLPELCLRMTYVHLITLFEAALSDIIRATLLYKPKILKSKKMISYEDVLSEPDMGSLVAKIVDKEISDLTYGSIDDLIEYLKNKLHIPIEFLPEEKEELNWCKAQRNILVHNQGRVDEKFLRVRAISKYSMGESIIITESDWDDARYLLKGIVSALESAVVRKFKLA
ncbi:hypothetical protein PS662_01179 [Pseudomonas fluorescens]|uniref:RiboL-PSP-HEPN domain-containing protein n=1 Tax=Pseudomonas fluorescens TaxID=294 RepID=A0A5E6QRX0_PSEFL|nr:hypothetical protein [Pseudomonas fluorescens]VVM58423.1 hypothetical protein PS662_01179 [Pseudomonas fluorescens]